MTIFEDKMSKQHKTNEDHASDPKIGDYWSEMFAPILVVVGRPDPDSVLICDKTMDVEERRWTWDLTQCRIMTLEEFHARLRYDSIPGFWADCCPEHMTWVKDRAMELMFGPKEEETTVTDKPGIRYPGDDGSESPEERDRKAAEYADYVLRKAIAEAEEKNKKPRKKLFNRILGR